VIVPYLRGVGPTRFREPSTMRSGQLSALAADALELAAALSLERFVIVGHDWGARAAYIAATLEPARISHCIALSVGWGTNHPGQELPLRQARNYWYHWYMALDRGADAFTRDPVGFARLMWETWGPESWFTEAEFAATSKSFANPDWIATVLHSYRHRWGHAAGDTLYDKLEERLVPPPAIGRPTLVIHGAEDGSNDATMSAGRERYFSDRYLRLVIDGIGHFPSREAPDQVAGALLEFLQG
jgi:pimeloyl-ACP methyl ester carboxylesterase